MKTNIPQNELKRLYLDERWTMKAIATYFNSCDNTIRKRLNSYGIVARGLNSMYSLSFYVTKHDVKCPICGGVRSLSGNTIARWARLYHKSPNDYLFGIICISCSHPKKVDDILTVSCPMCYRNRTVKRNCFLAWRRYHHNNGLTLEDYAKEPCRSCKHKMHYRSQFQLGIHDRYEVLCPCCKIIRSITGEPIIRWLRMNPAKTIDDYALTHVCRVCRDHAGRHVKVLDGKKEYMAVCPNCGKERTIKASAIRSWCSVHNKSLSEWEDYFKESLCNVCASVKQGYIYHCGYAFVRLEENDPYYCMAHKGRVQVHRYIMAQILGRPLQIWEQVHHRDGNIINNHPSNLELRTLHHHGNGASITPSAEELLKRVIVLWGENSNLKKELARLNKGDG